MTMLKRVAAILAATFLLIGVGASPALAANEVYNYAGAGQTIAATKLAANMTVENPYTDIWDGHHVVKELAVIRGGATGTFQAVEVGWNVDNALYGDQNTHVFTYAWVNDVGLGYNNVGGSTGFVSCSGIVTPCTAAGQSVISGPNGSPLSGSKAFVIEYQTVAGSYTGWWVSYNGSYMGYWPASLWASANGGAFVQSDRVDLFSEVQSWTWTSPGPCDDMGVNFLPTGTTGSGIFSTTINGTSTGVDLHNYVHATSPTHYNAVMATGSIRSLYVGGDGWC